MTCPLIDLLQNIGAEDGDEDDEIIAHIDLLQNIILF